MFVNLHSKKNVNVNVRDVCVFTVLQSARLKLELWSFSPSAWGLLVTSQQETINVENSFGLEKLLAHVYLYLQTL